MSSITIHMLSSDPSGGLEMLPFYVVWTQFSYLVCHKIVSSTGDWQTNKQTLIPEAEFGNQAGDWYYQCWVSMWWQFMAHQTCWDAQSSRGACSGAAMSWPGLPCGWRKKQCPKPCSFWAQRSAHVLVAHRQCPQIWCSVQGSLGDKMVTSTEVPFVILQSLGAVVAEMSTAKCRSGHYKSKV